MASSSTRPVASCPTSPLRPRRRNTAPPSAKAIDTLSDSMSSPLPPMIIRRSEDEECSSMRPLYQRKTHSIHTSSPASSTQSSPQARIRPLPPVPGSATSGRDSPMFSPRPLPRTPSTSPPMTSYFALPAAPSSSSLPHATSHPAHAPSHSPSSSSSSLPTPPPATRPAPHVVTQSHGARSRPDALTSLLTVPENTAVAAGPPVSPISPPIPPSPATHKRRSCRKLARHFGEDVSSTVLMAPRRSEDTEAEDDTRSEVDLEPLVFRVRGECDSSDEDDDNELNEPYGSRSQRWGATIRARRAHEKAPPMPPLPEIYKREEMADANLTPGVRESKHWYHEAGGRRFEQDYADVIHKLRKL